MNQGPKQKQTIAVVVPVYNRPNVVLEALDGVARQTRPPDRLLVIDDGSTDETAANIQRWLDRNAPPFAARLVRRENGGVASARNRGAGEAGACDVLAFLDSDDIWPSDHLEHAAAALGASESAAAISRDRLNIDLRTGHQELVRLETVAADTTRRFFLQGPPGLSNTVFRARAFHELGGYDEAMCCGEEDYHFMLRMSLWGGWLHAPGDPVLYRRGTVDARGGADQLSKRCSDRRLCLARALQRFIDEDGGAHALDERIWRRRMGGLWHSAGRQLAKLGRRSEARDCFRRATHLRPGHLRARLRTWLG